MLVDANLLRFARDSSSVFHTAASTWLTEARNGPVRVVCRPRETDDHARTLIDLIARHRPTSNLISDVHLAALAISHGLDLYSADSDFARFP